MSTPATAPASTYILVVAVMAAFASFGTVLIFTPSWYWYLIPTAFAVVALAIVGRRWQVRHHARQQLRTTIEGLG